MKEPSRLLGRFPVAVLHLDGAGLMKACGQGGDSFYEYEEHEQQEASLEVELVHRFMTRQLAAIQALLSRIWEVATQHSSKNGGPRPEIDMPSFLRWHELISRALFDHYDAKLSRKAAEYEWSLAGGELRSGRELGVGYLRREAFSEWMYDVLEVWVQMPEVSGRTHPARRRRPRRRAQRRSAGSPRYHDPRQRRPRCALCNMPFWDTSFVPCPRPSRRLVESQAAKIVALGEELLESVTTPAVVGLALLTLKPTSEVVWGGHLRFDSEHFAGDPCWQQVRHASPRALVPSEVPLLEGAPFGRLERPGRPLWRGSCHTQTAAHPSPRIAHLPPHAPTARLRRSAPRHRRRSPC